MMTSLDGDIFRVTGLLCGEFTGLGEFPTQRPVTRSFDIFFDFAWINGWVNNREAGDLRRHRVHYDVTERTITILQFAQNAPRVGIPWQEEIIEYISIIFYHSVLWLHM